MTAPVASQLLKEVIKRRRWSRTLIYVSAGAMISFIFGVALIVGLVTSQGVSNMLGPTYAVTGVAPPSQLLPIFQDAANADGVGSLSTVTQMEIEQLGHIPCEVPWQLLAATAYVESHYQNGETSGAGAQGIMQFEPSTFSGYYPTIDLLQPPQGSNPPTPNNISDAIYASDLMMCSNGATPGTSWSVGDTNAVGIYNCGGAWLQNPSGCSYNGFTTAQYITEVHSVFNSLLQLPISKANNSTPTPISLPPTQTALNNSNPIETAIGAAAISNASYSFPTDQDFLDFICASVSPQTGGITPPTSANSLVAISHTPAVGEFAVVASLGNEIGVVTAVSTTSSNSTSKNNTQATVALVQHGTVTLVQTSSTDEYGLVAGV